jgi:hypothetical protein
MGLEDTGDCSSDRPSYDQYNATPSWLGVVGALYAARPRKRDGAADLPRKDGLSCPASSRKPSSATSTSMADKSRRTRPAPRRSTGHRSPTLSARYSHRRLYDLDRDVNKPPNFLPCEETETAVGVLRATGSLRRSAKNRGSSAVLGELRGRFRKKIWPVFSRAASERALIKTSTTGTARDLDPLAPEGRTADPLRESRGTRSCQHVSTAAESTLPSLHGPAREKPSCPDAHAASSSFSLLSPPYQRLRTKT